MKTAAICLLVFSLIGVLQAMPSLSNLEAEMEEEDLLALQSILAEVQEDSDVRIR